MHSCKWYNKRSCIKHSNKKIINLTQDQNDVEIYLQNLKEKKRTQHIITVRYEHNTLFIGFMCCTYPTKLNVFVLYSNNAALFEILKYFNILFIQYGYSIFYSTNESFEWNFNINSIVNFKLRNNWPIKIWINIWCQ